MTLSSGFSRLSWRPTRSDAHSPDVGMTCIVPMALAGETTAWLKPDSWNATAWASAGSTPIARAVAATLACISRLRRACRALRSVAWFAFAAATTESA